MAQTYTTLVGAAPNILTNFGVNSTSPGWLNWYRKLLNFRYFYCAGVPRKTYYYFAESGNDSGAGTKADPFKTVAKAQTLNNASTGYTAFLFKRGDVFDDTGGLLLDKPFNMVGSYGTIGSLLNGFLSSVLKRWNGRNPLFNRFTVKYNQTGWGSASGDRYQRAETNDIAWVRDQRDRLGNPYTRVASAAAVITTARSFFWGANVLYVNAGTGIDPNTLNLEAVISNQVAGINLGADGTFARDIDVHGYDMDRGTVSPQQYCLKSSVTGTDACLFLNCGAFYSSSHVAASHASSGGFTTMIGVKAGYAKYANGESIFNFFTDSGGHEFITHNCECTYGTLPSSDWVGATAIRRGEPMYAHTNTGTISLAIVYGFVTKNNPYGAQNVVSAFGNLPSVSSITDVVSFNVGEVFEGGDRSGFGTVIAPNKTVQMNCTYYIKPNNTGQAALATGVYNGWFINSYLDFDMTYITETIYGVWNTVSSQAEPKIYNSHIHARNYSVSTGEFGMEVNNLFNPNNFLSNGEMKNSILTKENFTGATPAIVRCAFNNDPTKCFNNAYFGVTQSGSSQNRDYNLQTSPVTLSAQPVPLLPAVFNSQLYHTGVSISLTHDAKLTPRQDAPSIGPIDELPYEAGINFHTNLSNTGDSDNREDDFEILIPNETFGGSTYTFKDIPDLVVVDDGKMLRPISTDGNVNWSISGLVVTLQVAATSSCYGIKFKK